MSSNLFFFFGNIRRTPSRLGGCRKSPPGGHTPTPHRTPHNARKRANPTPTRPHSKTALKRPTTPHTAPTPEPTRQHQQHNARNGHNTKPGRLFKITFYTNRKRVAAQRGNPPGAAVCRLLGCWWYCVQVHRERAAEDAKRTAPG